MSRRRPRGYPHNWNKASLLIRRLANGICEWCHKPSDHLSVHHIGAPRPDGMGWKKGNASDKHDIRRENLAAICYTCHCSVDHLDKIKAKRKLQRAKRKQKHEQHAALGVGTGLILYTLPAAA